MFIVHADTVVRVPPGTTPDYNSGNPLAKLLGLVEQAQFAAEREHYLTEHTQYLFPYSALTLYGPQGAAADVLEPTRQDSKTDFQKQNLKDFLCTDTQLCRGLVAVGDWIGPFLRASYRAGPDSALSQAAGHDLGPTLKLWIKVGSNSTMLDVPYNPRTDRYDVELWGYPAGDPTPQLDARGRESLARGELQIRTDLIRGDTSDFAREKLNDLYMPDVAPENSMHPVLPLHVELAWANADQSVWDSKNGSNYQYEFNMIMRGWDNFLGTGISANPHGGVGFLEYRNLMSNYGRYAGRNELGRGLESWNFNAYGSKDHGNGFEPFFAVDYMDLHILKSRCGIGLHRHRDNQEVFFMMSGQGYMAVGDWAKMPQRERCMEVRTLRAGHFAMLKGGNLHALMNATDEDISLFMFGGYD